MKKVILTILINFAVASNVFAYTVIKDPNVFYSFFEKPANIIDFAELKDGTLYGNLTDRVEADILEASGPSCINNRAGNLNALTVGPSAFSNTWSFLGAEPVKAQSFCDAVLWFDQGISTGDYNLAVSTTPGRSKPFAIYTNKGFMGIIPDTPQETLFIFENLHFIFSFETEFSTTAPVPESEASFMAQIEIN
ncbi:MAG: hypothetical protein PVJ77_16100 [Desulfobacterales bacterium]